jgi:hypothetical protein
LKHSASTNCATAYPINKKYNLKFNKQLEEIVGRDNSVGIAILYGLDDPGIEIFRTRPDRPWGLVAGA